MRRTLALPALVAAALAAGCGGEASVERLAAPIASGVNVDYTPLASPRDAVAKADLIVEGTLTDVTEGIDLTFPDRRYTERKAGSYATFVVTVDRVVSGDAAKLRDKRVYLAVRKSRTAQIGELAGANPQPRIVAVLDDITDWTPAADVGVTRPAALPPDAPLYAPYTDGIWLQAAGDTAMHGLHADPQALTAAWGHPQTVSQFSATVQRATAQR